jgi:hypothetical protein
MDCLGDQYTTGKIPLYPRGGNYLNQWTIDKTVHKGPLYFHNSCEAQLTLQEFLNLCWTVPLSCTGHKRSVRRNNALTCLLVHHEFVGRTIFELKILVKEVLRQQKGIDWALLTVKQACRTKVTNQDGKLIHFMVPAMKLINSCFAGIVSRRGQLRPCIAMKASTPASPVAVTSPLMLTSWTLPGMVVDFLVTVGRWFCLQNDEEQPKGGARTF